MFKMLRFTNDGRQQRQLFNFICFKVWATHIFGSPKSWIYTLY